MKGRTIIRRSLAYYWRTHLGVVLGAAVAAAVLVGALAVGDCVRYSLRRFALLRLGATELAVAPGDRFFRAALADDLQKQLSSPAAPVLLLGGVARGAGGAAQAGGVQVLGVDERFWALGAGGSPSGAGDADGVLLNERLAERLGCAPGQTVVLRVQKPSLLPREAPLSVTEGDSAALRLTVAGIVDDEHMGRFGLTASQTPPYNAFLPLRSMQQRLDSPGKANLLLLAGAEGGPSLARASAAIRSCWQLADAGLEVRELPQQQAVELRTGRIFLDAAAAQAAAAAEPGARGVLTYFVNELRVGDRSTPYSMVSAIGPLPGAAQAPAAIPPVPAGMRDDETVINDWLAADLKASAGDELEMTYFVLGPLRDLAERTSRFRIRAVAPLRGAADDPNLMPDFPGLAGSEHCRDWNGGVPIHLDRIRRADEDYWHEHRGTPKAFITLAAGRGMWGSRFGDLTAVRYPLTPGAASRVAEHLRAALDPAAVGLFPLPVRAQALAASAQGLDFGQLFLGLSFFLIVAALVLTGLLFVFGVEHRCDQTGLLLALGCRPRAVRRLLLAEGAALALAGAVLGAPAGLLYTRAVIGGLAAAWSGAVAGSALQYHATASSVAIGAGAGLLAAVGAMWAALRRQTSRPPRELLAARGAASSLRPTSRRRRALLAGLALAAAAAAGVIVAATGAGRDRSAAGAFFGAGALLLIAGLALLAWLLAAICHTRRGAAMTLVGLALRNMARRRGRSLAVAMLVACGSFLIVSVAANRPGAAGEAEQRSSGTGGFALYGQAAVSIYQDLNTSPGRKALGLDDAQLAGAEFLALRLHDGDDASCLNLNRAQSPRLLGVPVAELRRRRAFTFVRTLDDRDRDDPWRLLEQDFGPAVVPAVGDDATVTWALGKKLGDSIPYRDGRGREFQVRIVGVIANSIFQGGLLISRENFLSRFPDEAGWRVLLADAPADRAAAVAAALERALADRGLEVTPAGERLAAFNTVQNTYLSIFQALGGIGMVLGAVGVGVTVLRNVLERRGELALLRAVGFTRRALRRMIFLEHAALLLLGLAWGTASALLAVLPALRAPGAELPLASLAITLAAVAASGVLWIHLASTWALRGPLLLALREE